MIRTAILRMTNDYNIVVDQDGVAEDGFTITLNFKS